MKRFSLTLFAAALLLTLVPAGGQQPKPEDLQQQQILTLVKEVQAQQLEISANQAKIDAKIAAVAEEVRKARIFSSRGG